VTEPAQPAVSESPSSQGWSTKKWVTNIAGGLILAIGLRVLVSFEDRLPSFGVVLPTYTLGFLVAVFVHELGHLVAALLVRFEVVTFAAWPVVAHRSGQRWKLGVWRPGRFSIGGFVSACPLGTHDLVKRMLWITAGGPAASWTLVIVAAVLVVFLEGGSQSWVSTLLTALVFWSALIGIISLVSHSGKHALSDGSRIRMLRRGGPEAERFVCIMILLAKSMRGQRPRDWDPELVRRAATHLDYSPDSMSGQVLRYNWLHDSRQLEEAGPLAEWIAGRIQSREGQQAWQFEVAWFKARHRADLPAARQWFDRAGGPGRSPAIRCAYFKAKAAIDLAEQRWLDAAAAARAVAIESDKISLVGVASAIRDEAEELLRDVESAKASAQA